MIELIWKIRPQNGSHFVLGPMRWPRENVHYTMVATSNDDKGDFYASVFVSRNTIVKETLSNESLCLCLYRTANIVVFYSDDDVIKWKHFPRNWPFVRGIHRSPVNSPHKGQWRGALMFSLICVWINDWVNNREAGHLRRYPARYDVIVMVFCCVIGPFYSYPSGLLHRDCGKPRDSTCASIH